MGYGIAVRITSEFGLFTRPEMKAERMSYDIITPSAARGILEAVYWKPAIRWVIDRITILSNIEFTNIRRNEVSVKASTDNALRTMNNPSLPLFISAVDSRLQRGATVLRNPDYLIEAHFEMNPERSGADDTPEKHYNIILRRLRNGQHFMQPCMGTREFPARVELVEESFPKSPLQGSLDLGWMLFDIDFSDQKNIQPKFFRASLQDGVLDLADMQRPL
jgi:CRISPR-associated protein Cas5d